MSLQQRISGLLTRLRDPDTLSLAERELKTLIVNEIDDGDKLATMIGCIGDHSEHSPGDRRGKQTHLCLFIAIAETFQHQILEYLPKIFAVLNRKIREGDLDASESVSESYGGVFEFAFKGTEREEALSTFRDSVKPLLDFLEKGSRNSQSIAATSLTKVVQNCQIFLLEAEFDWVFGQLLRTLQGSNCRAPFNLLEAVLSLLLSQKERVSQIARGLSAELSRLLSDEDWRVRKICLDLFYSMLVIDANCMNDFPSHFQELLLSSKGDKSKPVREAAMECLKLFNTKAEIKGDQKGDLKGDFRNDFSKDYKIDYKAEFRAETPKKPSEIPHTEKQRSKRNVITNQKMNLDHVQPTIKRSRLNSDFLKQRGAEITQVLVKEPRVKINYEEFMSQNEAPPIEKEVEKSSRVFEEPEPKKSEVLSGQNFETFQPPRDSTEKELSSLKKYIKVLNGKFKELQGNFVEVQRSNAVLLQKVEGLQRSVYQLSMISESRLPEKQERKIEFSTRNLPTKGVNDSLFAVLSLGEGSEAEEALLGFLRVSKHFSALDTIEKTLLDKLIFRLMRLTSEGFQGDFVLADYALRWLGGCLDRSRIREQETLKKLHALLLFLVASLDDEDTKQAALRLSKHPAFRNPAEVELFDPHEFVQGEHNLSRELDM